MKPSEQIEQFLSFVNTARSQYSIAYSAVNEQDKLLQPLLHEIELAENYKERCKAATKLRDSRKTRRENKDITLQYQEVVNFFNEKQNADVINKLTQLLGKQRKQEDYIFGNRVYKGGKSKWKRFITS